jgi:FkbM family methyltransferase
MFVLLLFSGIICASIFLYPFLMKIDTAMKLNAITTAVNASIGQFNDVRAHLHDFESTRWFGMRRCLTVPRIPPFPPQMTIVKACSMCNTSYWMAFPTKLTLLDHRFPGENGIYMEMATGIWDTAETRLANAVLSFGCQSGKSRALMVDVGMNTGYFSGMALAAGCRVVGFEPTKYHHPYALVTAMLSGYEKHFTLYPLAASDKTGEEIPFDDWSFVTSENIRKSGDTLSTVTTIRVDDVVHEDVLYLKVDVEGNEPAVFRGLRKLLESKVVLVILWENYPFEKTENIELPADYLKKLGYFISELHHGGAGNFVALHPRVDLVLRETIMSMKDINIKGIYSYSGLDWWNYTDAKII